MSPDRPEDPPSESRTVPARGGDAPTGEDRTVAEVVRAHLEEDLVLREALRRDIVNQRGVARWLVSEAGLEGSQDAVLSALRRVADEPGESPLSTAYDLIARAHLDLRSRVCILVLPKEGAHETVAGLLDVVDYNQGEILRILHGRRHVKVLIDRANLTEALSMVGRDAVQRRHDDLTEVKVGLEAEKVETPGTLGLMATTLALADINIVDFFAGTEEEVFLVDADDAMPAYRALHRLIRTARRRTGETPS